MAIKRGVWVECDGCGEPSGDAGTPIPALFDTEREAISDAVDNCDWQQLGGRLLCPTCAEKADEPDEDEAAGTWEERAEAAVTRLFAPDTAVAITKSEAFGPLVYRLRRYCETSGATAREALEAIDADARAFADARAENPAAFLAKQLRELAGE